MLKCESWKKTVFSKDYSFDRGNKNVKCQTPQSKHTVRKDIALKRYFKKKECEIFAVIILPLSYLILFYKDLKEKFWTKTPHSIITTDVVLYLLSLASINGELQENYVYNALPQTLWHLINGTTSSAQGLDSIYQRDCHLVAFQPKCIFMSPEPHSVLFPVNIALCVNIKKNIPFKQSILKY